MNPRSLRGGCSPLDDMCGTRVVASSLVMQFSAVIRTHPALSACPKPSNLRLERCLDATQEATLEGASHLPTLWPDSEEHAHQIRNPTFMLRCLVMAWQAAGQCGNSCSATSGARGVRSGLEVGTGTAQTSISTSGRSSRHLVKGVPHEPYGCGDGWTGSGCGGEAVRRRSQDGHPRLHRLSCGFHRCECTTQLGRVSQIFEARGKKPWASLRFAIVGRRS